MRSLLHRWRKPTGIRIRLSTGMLATIPDSAIERRPGKDRNGCAVWVATIPARLDVRQPPEVFIARLPGRTIIEIRIDERER